MRHTSNPYTIHALGVQLGLKGKSLLLGRKSCRYPCFGCEFTPKKNPRLDGDFQNSVDADDVQVRIQVTPGAQFQSQY